MAIIAAHGQIRTLPNGLTRYYVVIADASGGSSLLAALGAGIKGLIVDSALTIDTACNLEIKVATGATVPLIYLESQGANSTIVIEESDGVISADNDALTIETSVACAIGGFIDVRPGPNP